MNVREIEQLARELMAEHGLTAQGWRFKWDRAAARGGQCRYSKREIGLSLPVYGLPENSGTVRNTLLHEIAHALVGPGVGHGAAWKRQARAIGCNAERCVNLAARPKGKYSGTCGCDTVHEKSRLSRQPNGEIARYTCVKCRWIVTWAVNR